MATRGEEEYCGGRLQSDCVEDDRDLGRMGAGGGGRRRTRGGKAVGGASCWRIVGIMPTTVCVCILVLVLASSASCLPLEEAAVRGGGGGLTGGRSEDEEVMLMRNIEQETARREREEGQQLLHQGQLYLPSLFQNQQVDDGMSPPSTKTSDYPRYYQREEDALGTEWATVIDPHVYVLNEWVPAASQLQQRKKRSPNAGPSLSITNSLDVLRQRLLLEIARRKMIKSQNQILANAQILKNIG